MKNQGQCHFVTNIRKMFAFLNEPECRISLFFLSEFIITWKKSWKKVVVLIDLIMVLLFLLTIYHNTQYTILIFEFFKVVNDLLDCTYRINNK